MTVLRSTTFQLHVKNEDGTTKMRTFTRAVSDADKTTEQLNTTLGENVNVTYKTVQSSRELTQQARMQVTQMERVNKAYRDQVAQLNHQIAIVDKSAAEQAALNAVMRLGAGATDAQKKEVYDLTMAYHGLRDAQHGASGSMRDMRGIAQNFGWQLQDTVVQLQMGTDAMIVLSQQGSQMAAAFGAAGAVVGAAIAIFGAVTPAIIAALGETEIGVKELEEAQKSLNEVFDTSSVSIRGYTEDLYELYKVDKQLAELKLLSSTFEAEKLIKSTREQVNEYTSVLRELGKGFRFTNSLQQEFDEDMQDLSETYNISVEDLGKLNDAYQKFRVGGSLSAFSDEVKKLALANPQASEAFIDLASAITTAGFESGLAREKLKQLEESLKNGIVPSTEEARDAVLELIDSYTMKTIALTQTDREQAIHSSLLNLSSDATDKERDAVVKSINTYYDRKDAIDAQNEAEKERVRLAKEREKQVRAAEKAEQDAIMRSINLQIKAENQRIKSRDALLKPIESDVNKQIYTQEEQELTKHTQRMEILQTELVNTLDFEFYERQRINTLMEQEQERHKQAMSDISTNQLMAELTNAQTFLSGMNQITGQLAGLAEEGTKEAEVLFYANQAIAFANAIINTEQAATKALVDGGTFAGMSMASIIRATGYASAGIIAGTTLAGAFDKGGIIPAGQKGIVAEYGDELVGGTMVYNNSQSGLKVTGRKETAEMMAGQAGGVPQVNIYMTVTGNGDKALAAATRKAAEEGAKRGADIAYARVSNDFATGRGIRQQLRKSTGI